MKKIFLIAAITCITGCTSMNSNFECPLNSQFSCKSLKEIDQMVSKGAYAASNKKIDGGISVVPQDINGEIAPKRIKEEVVRVWFAPFEDVDGNYHQDSSIYTVKSRSYWSGNPPKSTKGASS